MANFVQRFIDIKTRIGGNREKHEIDNDVIKRQPRNKRRKHHINSRQKINVIIISYPGNYFIIHFINFCELNDHKVAIPRK